MKHFLIDWSHITNVSNNNRPKCIVFSPQRKTTLIQENHRHSLRVYNNFKKWPFKIVVNLKQFFKTLSCKLSKQPAHFVFFKLSSMHLKTNFYDSIYINVRIYSLITKMNFLFTYLLTYLLTLMIKMKEKRRKFINQSEFQYIFQDP